MKSKYSKKHAGRDSGGLTTRSEVNANNASRRVRRDKKRRSITPPPLEIPEEVEEVQPVSTEDTVVGNRLRPTDYREKAGWFRTFKRKLRLQGRKAYQWHLETMGDEEGAVINQHRIDVLRSKIYNSNVTNMYLDMVNGRYTTQYHHTSTLPSYGTISNAAVGSQHNLRDDTLFRLDQVSFSLMTTVKAILGPLVRTNDNVSRVRNHLGMQLKKMYALNRPEVLLVSADLHYNVIENALMMYFVPSIDDVVRHSIVSRDPVYNNLVNVNNQIAGSRQLT